MGIAGVWAFVMVCLAGYHREGFVVVENLIPLTQVQALGQRLLSHRAGGGELMVKRYVWRKRT